ncbi:MAG TPA: nicotinate-nucleotide adenylyltransferase [Gammaproteobacteria bacterium]|nr:nicotinate-nucleotide adenylyltransferase [Gammaproteobacteria bacterium]
MQRIGLLGGMFDPVHNGHLRIAVECQYTLSLDQLRMLPCAAPAHREMPGVSPQWRLKMLQAALHNVEGIIADDRELKRPAPSYTIDTLRAVKAEFPQASLYLIIGSDAFQSLNTWHEWRSLLSLTNIVIARRPDHRPDCLSEVGKLLADAFVTNLPSFLKSNAGKICVINVCQLEISSSCIRALLNERKSVQFLLPDSVIKLIQEHHLYP